jgi:putative NADH-flavin reductase
MQNNLPIAIIGGTGKSGKYLVAQLLSKGQAFKLLVRDLRNFQIKSPLIELVQGDVRDYTAVQALLKGCRAVISTLGQPKGESPIFSAATVNVLRAMDAYGVKRYILTTGLNVDTPSDQKGSRTSAATEWMKANYTATTADKQEEYALLAGSAIDWTLVRLPMIELSENKGRVATSLEDCPGDKIGSTDLADFLIAQLVEKEFLRKSPFIANVLGLII